MADSKISINLGSAKSALETIKVANNKLQLAMNTMSGNPFSPLCSINPDLASNYVNQFQTSLNEVISFSNKVHSAINSYVQEIETEENAQDVPQTNGGSSGGSGGSGGGSSGESSSQAPVTTPTDPSDGTTQVKPLDTTSLVDLELNETIGIVEQLKDLSEKANQGIDEMLLDPEMADKLKELFLNSPYIPDEFKALLADADSQVVRQTILSLMNGEMPEVFDLNPLNLGIVYTHLKTIAEQYGITVEELLSNPLYAEDLKVTLSGFNDVVDLLKTWDTLPAEQYQENLLKLYDGDGIGNIEASAVDVMRTFADYISGATDIAAEELLTQTQYADVMKEAAQELAKTSVFMDATSHYSTEGMQEVVGNLFNGKNAAALGMSESDVIGFQKEIDALAKENGITSSRLLSDSSYADTVTATLNSSKNASEIGTIFANSETTVSQNVAKNLYNTTYESSTNTESMV